MRDYRNDRKGLAGYGDMPKFNEMNKPSRPPEGTWFDIDPSLRYAERPVRLTLNKLVWVMDDFSGSWQKCKIVSPKGRSYDAPGECSCEIIEGPYKDRVITIPWQFSKKILGYREGQVEKTRRAEIPPSETIPEKIIHKKPNNRPPKEELVTIFENQEDINRVILKGKIDKGTPQ